MVPKEPANIIQETIQRGIHVFATGEQTPKCSILQKQELAMELVVVGITEVLSDREVSCLPHRIAVIHF